jgi:hypothetical protein
VLKCLLIIFSKEIVLSNLCSQIILGIILISIFGAIIFSIIENNIIYKKIKLLIRLTFLNKRENKSLNNKEDKRIKNNQVKKFNKTVIDKGSKPFLSKANNSNSHINIITSEFKGIKSNSKKPFSFKKFLNKNTNKVNTENNNLEINKISGANIMKYNKKTDNELNSLSYSDAILYDKRTFCQYYFSLIMTKQLIIFTFNSKNDYNSKIIKFCFLLYTLAIFLFVNTAFIDDNILHDLYLLQGKISIFHFINIIIYTTIISTTIKNILLLIIFTESNIISIREDYEYNINEKVRQVLAIIRVKCCLFFVLMILTLSFLWIYLSCFFSIFRNTQIFVLKNTLISFGISSVIPIILGIFPCIMRCFALINREKQDRVGIYHLSKILQIII